MPAKKATSPKAKPVSATIDKDGHFSVGTKVFVRTVTLYYVGRIAAKHERTMVLEDCAWVADTDKWGKTLAEGKVRAAEAYPDGPVILNKEAIVDVAIWNHDLIRADVNQMT